MAEAPKIASMRLSDNLIISTPHWLVRYCACTALAPEIHLEVGQLSNIDANTNEAIFGAELAESCPTSGPMM